MNYLKSLYLDHQSKSSDKWGLYLDVYDDLLSGSRSDIINFLEIGVQNGGSLEIWSKYFPSAENLIGCDINPDCKKLDYENDAINIVIGNSSDLEIKNEITKFSKEFDLVIDDGSHLSSDIIKSFLLYFPLISDGGVYIIEDLHASYWKNFEGGLYYPYSSISFLKKIADVVNFEHWGIEKEIKDFLLPFYEFYNCENIGAIDYSTIHSVTFLNSICIIKKKTKEKNVLGPRYIAGSEWGVFQNNKNSHGLSINPVPQNRNEWSQLNIFPEMMWEVLNNKITYIESDASKLSKERFDLENELLIVRGELDEVRQKNDFLRDNLALEFEKNDKNLKDLIKQNQDLLNSTSWKITRPLRALMKRIRGF